MFAGGRVIGDLTRRLVKDHVPANIHRMIEEYSSRDDHHIAEPEVQAVYPPVVCSNLT